MNAAAVKRKIEIGTIIGRLTVMSQIERAPKQKQFWQCRCVCGKDRKVRQDHLASGATSSCGCAHVKHGHALSDQKNSSEFNAWMNIRSRCQRVSHPKYADYGGVGIIVCERWSKFENFLADMGACPSSFVLGRLDIYGNFEPKNCRWISRSEHQKNRRKVSKALDAEYEHFLSMVGCANEPREIA